jgi:hypothetical protein
VRKSPSFKTCSDAKRARSASSGGFRFMRSAVAPSTETNKMAVTRVVIRYINQTAFEDAAHLSKQPIASGTFFDSEKQKQ